MPRRGAGRGRGAGGGADAGGDAGGSAGDGGDAGGGAGLVEVQVPKTVLVEVQKSEQVDTSSGGFIK